MRQALDLAALDRALGDLVEALGVNSLGDVMVDAGEIVANSWRGEIQGAGLVDTGRYLDSIFVEQVEPGREAGVKVQVASSARTDKGEPYPFFLEFGTSDIFPHPVAQRAFDTTRRKVVKQVGADVERKVRSRVRR